MWRWDGRPAKGPSGAGAVADSGSVARLSESVVCWCPSVMRGSAAMLEGVLVTQEAAFFSL